MLETRSLVQIDRIKEEVIKKNNNNECLLVCDNWILCVNLWGCAIKMLELLVFKLIGKSLIEQIIKLKISYCLTKNI